MSDTMLNFAYCFAFVAVLVALILRRRSQANATAKPAIGRSGLSAKVAKQPAIGRGPSIGRRL